MGGPGVEHGHVPAEVHLLDRAAEAPERLQGVAGVRLHLLVDLVVAEVHGEGDLPPLDGFERVRDLQLGRSEQMSSGCGPAITFCMSAPSATLRVMGP